MFMKNPDMIDASILIIFKSCSRRHDISTVTLLGLPPLDPVLVLIMLSFHHDLFGDPLQSLIS